MDINPMNYGRTQRACTFDEFIMKLREKGKLEIPPAEINRNSGSSEHKRLERKVQILNETEGKLDESIYDCPLCKNKGVIYFIKAYSDYEGVACVTCDCMELRESRRRIKKSGIEPLLKYYTFESYKTDKPFQRGIKQRAEEFVNGGYHESSWFFIGGQVGCGKTHICTAIAGELLKNGKAVRYMQWRDDATKLKAYANSEERDELIKPFKETKVLYIDDLFKTQQGVNVTPADVNLAFEILNYRYNNRDKLITIISSEKLIPEIIAIDEAVGSRIKELCGAKFSIGINPDKEKNYRLGA